MLLVAGGAASLLMARRAAPAVPAPAIEEIPDRFATYLAYVYHGDPLFRFTR